MNVTLGGERLGSGNKQKIGMRNYERSTHDLSRVWKSSMSCGTLVPFMKEFALPGDTFDIDLFCEVLTLPTVGPLFGSFKVQLDIFSVPLRLYNRQLYTNKLDIGLDMSVVKLPTVGLQHSYKFGDEYNDNSQVNASCIFKYLGIGGIGASDAEAEIYREFNAVPYLAYFEIFKQYYSNKQLDTAYIIHNDMEVPEEVDIEKASVIYEDTTEIQIGEIESGVTTNVNWKLVRKVKVEFALDVETTGIELDEIFLSLKSEDPTFFPNTGYLTPNKIADSVEYTEENGSRYIIFNLTPQWWNDTSSNSPATILRAQQAGGIIIGTREFWINRNFNTLWTNTSIGYNDTLEDQPKLVGFPLREIDDIRDFVLEQPDSVALNITRNGIGQNLYINHVIQLPLNKGSELHSKQSTQEGLLVKCYQSDLNNNWMNTEWLDGENGINEITKVHVWTIDPETGQSIPANEIGFNIDSLNLAYKVYKMLNRIALSGGTYDDWIDSVYTHERAKEIKNPVYEGSLIKQLAFQQVVSNSETESEPLGTLAGRGQLNGKNKGGKMKIRINEPSYIMGIVSISPQNLDYSQGNDWDVNLKNYGEFHAPQLDEIGFEDKLTDNMAWGSTGVSDFSTVTYSSVGKQPAWINYMSAVNKTYGHFAEAGKEMYMTLNRRYEKVNNEWDFTTYIDPTKYNFLFAQTDISAQNFWVQIASGVTARRKMSAKVIPNL